jgi:hypothetical protein
MLRARKRNHAITGLGVSGAVLILAQLFGCAPSVESGSGTAGQGGGGAGGSGGAGQGGGGTGGSAGGANSGCECIADYGGSALDEVALKKLRDEGLPACFHQSDPAMLEVEQACLPSVVGQHLGDGRDIEIYYYCSDVCPDYGRIGVRYTGIKDDAACCAIGGIPLHDPGWGGFEGCVPSEIPPMVSWVYDCP